MPLLYTLSVVTGVIIQVCIAASAVTETLCQWCSAGNVHTFVSVGILCLLFIHLAAGERGWQLGVGFGVSQ